MTVRLNELGASSINFVVRVWSNSSDLQSVYWDVLERIKREFDANGISFPYPQMDVNFKRVKERAAENYAPGGAIAFRADKNFLSINFPNLRLKLSISANVFPAL